MYVISLPVLNWAKLFPRVKVEESKPRKASFISVSEALSCHRPHDHVIKQEMSCLKLPGMQVRP